MKILYIGYTLIGDEGATGSTLRNVYKYTDGEILQFCLDYNGKRHLNQCNVLYYSKLFSPLAFVLKAFYRLMVEGHSNSQIKFLQPTSSHKKRLSSSLLQGVYDISPKRLSNKYLHFVDEFKPEIIYTLGENISTLRNSIFFSERYNVPVVLHVMDDIESVIYTEGSLVAPFRKKYLKLLKTIYVKNHFHLSIGEKMALEYTMRHKCRFNFVMNCVENVYPHEAPNKIPLRIIFSGGLHGGRDKSLKEIAEMINTDDILNNSYELHVYTSKDFVDSNEDLAELCHLHEYVPAEKMIGNLSSADILLHVESFEPEEIRYFKYSMSTKIPEYLSVGRPLIGYGPEEISSIAYIRDTGSGLIAQDKYELKKVLFALCDIKIRHKFGEQAIHIAKCNHTSEIINKRMASTFSKAIDSYNAR